MGLLEEGFMQKGGMQSLLDIASVFSGGKGGNYDAWAQGEQRRQAGLLGRDRLDLDRQKQAHVERMYKNRIDAAVARMNLPPGVTPEEMTRHILTNGMPIPQQTNVAANNFTTAVNNARPQQERFGTSIHHDEFGNAYQASSQGGLKQVNPKGGRIVRPLNMQDVGGSVIGVNPITGAKRSIAEKTLAPAQTPKHQVDVQTQKTEAADLTADKMAFPEYESAANYTVSLMDKLIKHPGLEAGTGKSSYLPSVREDSIAFDALREQIQGKLFLSAYQQLKGGGSITEPEGKKAEAAMSRMKTAQSKADFIEAANEFKAIIKGDLNRQRKKLGIKAPTVKAMPGLTLQETQEYNELMRKQGQ